jgi:hypothetical protein
MTLRSNRYWAVGMDSNKADPRTAAMSQLLQIEEWAIAIAAELAEIGRNRGPSTMTAVWILRNVRIERRTAVPAVLRCECEQAGIRRWSI